MPLIQFVAYNWQKALPVLAVLGAAAWLAAFAGDPTSERAIFDCKSRDFLFAKQLIDAGLDVQFKSFAYRWDASYAVQMQTDDTYRRAAPAISN